MNHLQVFWQYCWQPFAATLNATPETLGIKHKVLSLALVKLKTHR